VVSRDLEVVLHGLDVISVVNDHVLDRIKVDGQGVLVVENENENWRTLYRLCEYLPQNEAGSQRLARVVSERKR
jgi:hypothetical protein